MNWTGAEDALRDRREHTLNECNTVRKGDVVGLLYSMAIVQTFQDLGETMVSRSNMKVWYPHVEKFNRTLLKVKCPIQKLDSAKNVMS